jgi:hypothetical protein
MAYSIVLFVHVLAALLLASSMSIEIVGLSRMRRANAVSEAQTWVNLAPRLPAIAGICALVLLVSGGYLTSKMTGWGFGWPKVALGAMFLIAPFASMTSKRMRRVRQELVDLANATAALDRVNDRFLKASLSVRSWILLGIIALMTAKPDLSISLLIIAISAAVGTVTGLVGNRRQARSLTMSAQASTSIDRV